MSSPCNTFGWPLKLSFPEQVVRGKALFASVVSAHTGSLIPAEALVHGLLQDRSRPPGDQLPDTGRGPETEADLSPIFVECMIPDKVRNCVVGTDRHSDA